MTRQFFRKILAVFLCLLITSSTFASSVTVHFSEDQTVTLRNNEDTETIRDSETDHASVDKNEAETGTEALSEPESAPETEMKTEPEAEPESAAETKMDADSEERTFDANTGTVYVSVKAPAEAFPDGTTMSVRDVDDEKTISAIEGAVSSQVSRIHAVDITFFDAEGRKIEPLLPISVTMTAEEKAENEDTHVIHVDEKGQAELIPANNVSSKAEEQSVPALDFDTSTIVSEITSPKAGIRTKRKQSSVPSMSLGIQAASEENALEKGQQDQAAESGASVEFTADQFLVYALVYTMKFHWKVDGTDYIVTVSCNEDAGIPDDAELLVKEIASSEAEYADYLEKTEEALRGEYKVIGAHFFKFRFVSDGIEIQPKAPVDVKVEVAEDLGEEIKAVQFGGTASDPVAAESSDEIDSSDVSQGDVPVSDTEARMESDVPVSDGEAGMASGITVSDAEVGTESELATAASFKTDAFAVHGIVGTTIAKNVLSSDGHNYRITVTCGSDAGIPATADLSVEEVLPAGQDGSDGFSAYGMSYEEYVANTENALGMEEGSTGYIRLFDIKIVDKDNPSVQYQPAEGSKVDVKIELADAESGSLSVVHFADENDSSDILESSTDPGEGGQVVSFETDGFSVYAVVDEGSIVKESRMTLNFYDENGAIIATVYVKNDDDTDAELEQIIYDPGTGVLNSGELFKGWILDKPDYTVDDVANKMDIEEIRAWAKAKANADEIVEGEVHDIYPMIYKTYSVTFKDEDGVTIHSEALITKASDEAIDYTINVSYTPKKQDEVFQGWYWTCADGGMVVAKDGSSAPFMNGIEVEINDHTTFTVNVPKGYWLSFVENGSGASYTPPQFVPAEGNVVSEMPPNPTRQGYTFAGWNTKADGSGTTWTSSDFGKKLTERTILYAQWTPVRTAPYTVIIWKENIDGTGYDFAESIRPNGTVGQNGSVTQQGTGNDAYARVNGVNKQYTGFHLKEFDQNVKIAPEGNTVVNVYYDRTEYTFTFVDNQNPGRTYTEGTGNNANYGLVNGEYVQLTYANGVWTYPTGEYNTEYVVATNNNGTQYGLIDGEYVVLSRFDNQWHYSVGYSNNGNSDYTAVNGLNYYRQNYWGNEARIYWRNNAWRTGTNNYSDPYTGNIYVRYSGSRYREQETPVTAVYDGIRYVRGPESTTIHTVTAKYGTDISGIWNFTGTNGKTYPQTNPVSSWTPSGSSTYTARITRMETMPAENITFTHTTTSNSTRYFHYYVETADGVAGTLQFEGRQYELYVDLPNDFNIVYYNDDFWLLNGFTRQAIRRANSNHTAFYSVPLYENGTLNWSTLNDYSGQDDHLYFFYTRNKYPINYMDGKYVNGNGTPINETSQGQLKVVEDIYYQADISSFNKGGENYYEPTKTGYVFEGWYLDDACTHPVEFNKMPEGGITVYAKWRQKQYRVFLHPNVPTSDTSFDMGGQSTSFRVDYGDKIAGGNEIHGIRDDYELIGWYTDEACTQPYNFDAYVLNDTTVTTDYPKTEDTELDKYGNPRETGNRDQDRFWITRKLDLYAKWRSKIEGAPGINVQYDAVQGQGTFADGQVLHTDPLTYYLDRAESTAQGASVPSGTDKQFMYWVVQRWDETQQKYVDTDEHVYPGDTFEVQLANARAEDIPETTPGVTKKYTVQLRAEYGDKSGPTPTHIWWFPNNVEAERHNAVKADNDLQINEAVDIPSAPTREGYKFLGWARVADTVSGSSLAQDAQMPTGKVLDLSKDDLFLTYHEAEGETPAYYTAVVNGETKTVTKVAADENDPYHDMYAVWERWGYLKIGKHFDVQEFYLDGVDMETRWHTLEFTIKDSNGNYIALADDPGTEVEGHFIYDGAQSTQTTITLDKFIHETSPSNPHEHQYFIYAWVPVDKYVVEEDHDQADNLITGYERQNGEYGKAATVADSCVYGELTNIGNGEARIDNYYRGNNNYAWLKVEKEVKGDAPGSLTDNKDYYFVVKNDTLNAYISTDARTFTTDTSKIQVYKMKPGGSIFYANTGNQVDGNHIRVVGDNRYSVIELDMTTTPAVTEQEDPNLAGYELTKAVSAAVTPRKDDNPDQIITITNTYTARYGSLRLEKRIEGDVPAVAENHEYQFTVKNEAGKYIANTNGELSDTPVVIKIKAGSANALILNNLEPGSYIVTEIVENIPTYALTVSVKTGEDETGNNPISVGIEKNETTEVLFVNTYNRILTDIYLHKVDKEHPERLLPDSEFKLYRKNEAGTYAADETINATKSETTLVLTGGTLKVTGLPSGDYKLSEIKAPEGYVILNKDVYFTVNAEPGAGDSIITVTSGQTAYNDDSIGASTKKTDKNGDTFVVPNTPGVALPSTGGPGTNLLYLLGITLIGLAGAGFVMKRRRGKEA